MAFTSQIILIRSDPAPKIPDDFPYRTKSLSEPFSGLIILVTDDYEPGIPDESIRKIIGPVELNGVDWMYIEYVTWAGRIDAVRSFGECNGKEMTPYNDTVIETLEATYLKTMGDFGISKKDALDFPPFYRGFWDS
ncbi:MAG: hypothetical protein AAFY07_11925 [Pseudomonadota bacterium]